MKLKSDEHIQKMALEYWRALRLMMPRATRMQIFAAMVAAGYSGADCVIAVRGDDGEAD